MSGRKITLQNLITNLNRINEILTNTECRTLLNNFEKWMLQRKLSISALKTLHGKLTDNKFQCEIGRTAATTVGIMGGIAAAIGFGLSLFGDEEKQSTGNEMMKYGTVFGVGGGAVAVTISGCEAIRNHLIRDEVRVILEKDEQFTKELLPFLERSEIVNQLFEEVFDCGIGSSTGQIIIDLFKKIKNICQAGKKSYADISKLLSESITESPKQSTSKSKDPNLKEILMNVQQISLTSKKLIQEFCDDPKIRDIVLKICNFFDNPLTIRLIELSGKLLVSIVQSTKQHMSADLKSAISVSQKALKALPVALKVILIALDIVDRILNNENFEAETDKYIKMVRNVVTLLSIELKFVNDVYLAVNKHV